MTQVLAVAGFWTFMILLLFRKRFNAPAPSAELEQLRERVRQLEQTVGQLQSRVIALDEGHDYTLKLLKEPAEK